MFADMNSMKKCEELCLRTDSPQGHPHTHTVVQEDLFVLILSWKGFLDDIRRKFFLICRQSVFEMFFSTLNVECVTFLSLPPDGSTL